MQEHANLTIPLACPHCLAEILASLDQVEARTTIECSVCRTAIELRPEDVAIAPRWNAEPPETLYCGIQF